MATTGCLPSLAVQRSTRLGGLTTEPISSMLLEVVKTLTTAS